MKKILLVCFISVFCFINNAFGLESGNNLIIKIKDNEYKDEIMEKIKDKKFEFYKNNLGYDNLIFNETDTIIFNNLDYGNYVLKPIIIPGYKTDYYEYRVWIHELSEENSYVYINYEPIKGELIINKYFGSDNNFYLDNDSVFEIYKDNKLIKQLTPTNGVIKESLEYGEYLVKQISGEKYYDLVDEFSVNITEEKKYEFNLYTEIDSNLEQAFKDREELNKAENKIKENENELLELKQEIDKLLNSINLKEEELSKKQIEINNLNLKFNKDLGVLRNELNINLKLLEEEKLSVLEKEKIIKQLEEELCSFKNKKDDNLIVRTTLIEEQPLIVEVPNTGKKSFNISLLLMFVGIIVLIFGIKKVTNH